MKKIPVAKHLTDEEYLILQQVYADHNSSMALKEREKYNAAYIVKIERAPEKKALKVFYENGDWWHYTFSGKWY
jgi:hypothetical protein